MSKRPTAAIGFYALALLCLVSVAHQSAIDFIISRASNSGEFLALSKTLQLFEYGGYAISVGFILFSFMAGRLPASVRARSLMTGAAVLEILVLAVHVAQRTLPHGTTIAAMEAFFKWTSASLQVTNFVVTLAAGLAIYRVGIAAAANRSRLVAGAGTLPILVLLPIGLTSTLMDYHLLPDGAQKVIAISYEVAFVVHALALAWAGRQVGAVDLGAPSVAPESGPIGPGWHVVGNGIWTYLVALVVRILIGVLSFATLTGAADAYQSFTARESLHQTIITLGVVGVLAGLVMIAGVVMVASAPSDAVQGPARGAVACMVIGIAFDVGATWLTAAALESVSAAFTAMDVLPVLAAFTTSIGVIGTYALCRAFGAAAGELGLPDVQGWARSAGLLALVAGGLAAVTQLAIKGIPAQLAIILLFVILPGALFAAVQLLRVMLAVAGAIAERAPPQT